MKRATFNPIIEKISTRLASWKSKLLNKAGKLCLIQFAISAMPIHVMQSVWLSETVCVEIDKISRRFLSGKKDNARGIHLVSWQKVTKPKMFGGLGIRDRRFTNTSFLRKMIWKIINEPERLSS